MSRERLPGTEEPEDLRRLAAETAGRWCRKYGFDGSLADDLAQEGLARLLDAREDWRFRFEEYREFRLADGCPMVRRGTWFGRGPDGGGAFRVVEKLATIDFTGRAETESNLFEYTTAPEAGTGKIRIRLRIWGPVRAK